MNPSTDRFRSGRSSEGWGRRGGEERPARRPEPIAPPADPRLLAAEIARLAAAPLLQSGEYAVLLAKADSIPHLLYEIGRLRETTFRRSGEGTGAAMDLDWFDSHYLHLVVWNRKRAELVGAYRLAQTDEVLAQFGMDGLYTSTLFDYRMELFARINPALELGRAFVRPEYQRSYSALYLLWRGIGKFVARRPRYRMLFGSVSISNEYCAASQDSIVRYLREHQLLSSLAGFVSAKKPARLHSDFESPANDLPVANDLEELAAQISGLEERRRGLPILVKQYVRLGGRFLEFTRDPDFGDSLDALVVVDLARAPVGDLERYLGRSGCAAFLECHGRWPRGGRADADAGSLAE